MDRMWRENMSVPVLSLGLTGGSVLVFILGAKYLLKLGLDEINEMGCLIGISEGSTYENISDSLGRI